MRTSYLKRLIAAFALFAGIIIIAQVYWLQKLYSFEQRQFTANVVKSILGLYEDLSLTDGPVIHMQQFIQRPDANTFVARIDSIPDKDSLVYYMTAELEDFDVFTACNLAVYDHFKNNYAYSSSLPTADAHVVKGVSLRNNIKAAEYSYNFIQFSFPGRSDYILNEMKWWVVLAFLLTLALAALGASMIYLYRQKFLNETQSYFIRNITHEFQTPLTAFNLGLDMLSKPEVRKQPDKILRYTAAMQAQAQYLQQHLGNLVRLIRTDSFGLKLHKEDVSPVKLIQDAIYQLDFFITEKNATVHFTPADDELLIKADRSNLYLAILNILSNALKFASHPQINITTGVHHNYYVINIADNGIGIEKKHQKLLFKKFYRVPTGDVHDTKGLGLGLYFVKKIVNLHRGKIEVASQPGKGTEFKVSLPLN